MPAATAGRPAAFYLARSLEKLGRLDEAKREFRRVLDRADRPVRFETTTPLFEDLAYWQREIVELCRRHV